MPIYSSSAAEIHSFVKCERIESKFPLLNFVFFFFSVSRPFSCSFSYSILAFIVFPSPISVVVISMCSFFFVWKNWLADGNKAMVFDVPLFSTPSNIYNVLLFGLACQKFMHFNSPFAVWGVMESWNLLHGVMQCKTDWDATLWSGYLPANEIM